MAENENKETTEIKTEKTTEVKETAPKAKKDFFDKKSDRRPRRRPFGGAGKFGSHAQEKKGPFSDSLADRFGDILAAKLKRGIEDDIKRKIKAAQSDPAVQRASAKYGK